MLTAGIEDATTVEMVLTARMPPRPSISDNERKRTSAARLRELCAFVVEVLSHTDAPHHCPGLPSAKECGWEDHGVERYVVFSHELHQLHNLQRASNNEQTPTDMLLLIYSSRYAMCTWIEAAASGMPQDCLKESQQEAKLYLWVLPPLLPVRCVAGRNGYIADWCIKPNVEHLLLIARRWHWSAPPKVASDGSLLQPTLHPAIGNL